MKHSLLTYFRYFFGILIILSCVSQKKKGEYKGLSKFYHNTAAKYNAYFNANELLNLSISKLEYAYKDDYSKILAIFPYEAIEDVNFEKPNLDKAIEKVATDINIHKYSRWVDDCYLLLAKAQYLKKDYETAEGSFEYLINEYQPSKLLERSKSLKQKNVKAIKKEKEAKKEETKKETKNRNKKKIEAKKKAQKNAKKKKSSKKSSKKPIKELNQDKAVKEVEQENPIPQKLTKKKEEPKTLTNVGSKLFPHRPAYWEASIWAAKNLIRRGKYYEAEYKLLEIQNDPATFDYLKADLYATKAHLYLNTDNVDKAIPDLKNAILYAKNKKVKARYAYILGQLYQQLGRPLSSDEYFTQVLKYHPDFDMSFHAKMNSLINKSLQGESEESLITSLERLAKDSKNEEYESEIFVAIGKIYYNAKKYTEAIDYLNRAIWSPTSKPNIKSDAYYLLANIYFDQAQFQTSKYYFDSTLTFLSKSDKRRPMVSKMVFNLKDIAEQLEIINLQDSLIRISGLTNKEKRTLALDIKNRKRAIVVPNDMVIPEMNNEKVLRSPMLNRNSSVLRDMRGNKIDEKAIGGVKSTFFAYDIKAANRGRSSFEQYWGERILEDNWRRSKKSSFNSLTNELEEKKDTVEKLEIEEDLAELLAGIPSSAEEIKLAHKKIQEAMFLLGVAYRDKIEFYQRSKETLEKLLSRYPETERQADALYYLYLDCLDLKDQECADRNNSILKLRFADSYYAKLINDPEFGKSLMNKKNELEQGYEKAYSLFENQEYEESHKILQALATKVKADNPLHAKIALLSAFCIGKTSGKEPYMAALKDVIANYPGSAQESKAREILRFLRGDKEAFEVVNVVELQTAKFTVEDDKMHFMMIVFFDPPAKQIDKAKISISDYHLKYNKLDNLKMTSLPINTDDNVFAILIRKYETKTQAMKYYNAVQKNREEYIPGFQNFEIYPITQNNYSAILELRRVKEYQAFFKANYESN
ncbi:MAG: tetratricopeptide repeat protein [Saprospiraceae bacterium]